MAEISNKKKWIWTIVITVVLIGAGFGIGIPLYKHFNPSSGESVVIDISIHDAKSMIDDDTTYPDLIILDVRSSGEYSSGHLIDAIQLTWNTGTTSFDGAESSISIYNDTEQDGFA